MRNQLEQSRLRAQYATHFRSLSRDFADLELWGLILIGVTLVLFH